jgi:hypothetical protein
MVQVTKLSKEELKETGFQNKAIASRFLKTVLNKTPKDFKKKDELINTLKKEYNKMKNFGIDLNETSKVARKVNKVVKTATKSKERIEKLRKDRKDVDEVFTEMDIDKYLKDVANYKLPNNKNFKDKSKKIKQTYYYKWEGMEDVLQNITDLYRQQDTAFKFNISMAYLLKSTVSNEYKYMSAQYNNRLFDYPKTIENNKTLNEVLVETEEKLNNYKASRPDTQWKFYKFMHYEISVFRLSTVIGNAVSLPTWFYEGSNNKNVVKFDNFEDNLCFWRCLAAYMNPQITDYRNFQTKVKKLYMDFYDKEYDKSYEGVKYLEYKKFADKEVDESEYEKAVDEIDQIEQHFKININIYTQDEKDVTQIDRRSVNNNDVLYLLRHDNHFCYIKKIDNFVSSFKCSRCDKLWSNSTACHRHEKTCGDFCKHEFIGGYCEKTKSVFENLPKKYQDRKFFDYYIAYDFEAILSKMEDVRTDRLQYTNKHLPVSFSLFSNIDGYDKEPIFECRNDVKELIDVFVKTLVEMSAKAYEKNAVKYADVIKYLECQIHFAKNDKDKIKAVKKLDRFMKWLREVPVVGFNSAKYDANIMKMYLSGALTKYDKPEEGEVTPLKTNSMYRVITSKSLKFLDVANFLAAGVSLDKWLKAYKCTMTKGFFPYEWLDDYNKLDQDHLPSYNEWYSSLKGKNISLDDYNYCIDVWNENGMKTMKDFLRWYNNCDVIPMVEAIDKMFAFYRAKGLDMFKDAISLPGLAYKMLLTCTEEKFSLFDENNKNLFKLLKDNIVGGPSIIFHRYHEANKTRIRGGKLCKKVLGYDANALYLWAIAQVMPTGDYGHITNYDLNTLKEDVMSGALFGFVECNIKVPDNLYEHFAEMCPIFKNIDIHGTREIIGDHMFEYCQNNKIPVKKSRKLIGSMKGDKILLYTPLLKWYLEHGLEITKFYQAITYTPNTCFSGIADDIANARRAGDVDEDQAIIAETMKLIGNALYGRTVMDKEKHTTTTFCGLDKVSKRINDPHFKDMEELDDNRFEVMAGKHKIIMDTPIQIGCAVYQLAKLRMLQFYYDCLDKYVDRADFQYVEMDTDSAYLALSADKLDDVIKPHMKDEFETDKYNWFPNETTKELKAYNKRTPGLFKVEFEGNSIYALCSKLYFVEGDEYNKYSCKGIQKNQNVIDKNRFHNVLFNDAKDMCMNKGFRVVNNEMVTYIQQKRGLSYIYDKRRVLADGVSTAPLDI